jgi:hypothetical protein
VEKLCRLKQLPLWRLLGPVRPAHDEEDIRMLKGEMMKKVRFVEEEE